MTHPKQLEDTLDCGGPEETHKALIDHLYARANHSEQVALDLERDARDANEQAAAHFNAAQEFFMLARALEDAPVAFAAQAIEAQRAATGNTDAVHESAVGNADAPKE